MLASLFALAALAVGGTGCVTRTVYVVDNDARPARTAVTSGDAGSSDLESVEQRAGIVDPSDFEEPLAAYGRWMTYPGYGRVWQPSVAVVGAGFRPYTHGHWVMTEYGWTWVDHHPFGWATGHYGRWFYDSIYGWLWLPGTVWAPAWVSWRSGGGYLGWAPLPPGAFFGGAYSIYDTAWVFVSSSRFGVGDVGSVIVVGPAYHGVYAGTAPMTDTIVVGGRRIYRGPAEDDVVRSGGQVIHRPARDLDAERPTTRPPEGVARPRSRSSRHAATRSEDAVGERGAGTDEGHLDMEAPGPHAGAGPGPDEDADLSRDAAGDTARGAARALNLEGGNGDTRDRQRAIDAARKTLRERRPERDVSEGGLLGPPAVPQTETWSLPLRPSAQVDPPSLPPRPSARTGPPSMAPRPMEPMESFSPPRPDMPRAPRMVGPEPPPPPAPARERLVDNQRGPAATPPVPLRMPKAPPPIAAPWRPTPFGAPTAPRPQSRPASPERSSPGKVPASSTSPSSASPSSPPEASASAATAGKKRAPAPSNPTKRARRN